MGFRDDFLWGASTAAYQIEGAWDADGKGPGIWDALSRGPGRIARGENGEVSCDHYHRYKEDVALMREMGIKLYRFSISWPRVIPGGVGAPNPAGLKYYSDLVDELLNAGIEPMVTLYHWNMPYALFRRGGWLNEDSSLWFEEYTARVADALGDRIRYWLTFNEPQMFMFLGHRIGIHAPFLHCTDDQIIAMTRNVLLAHGRAVKVLRDKLGDKVKISIAPTGDCFVPADETQKAIEAAFRQSLEIGQFFEFSNRWWADPIYFGKLPGEAFDRFGKRMFTLTNDEMSLVNQKLDFFAYNIYQSQAEYVDGGMLNRRYEYPGCPITYYGWNVTPEVLYWSARFWHERYGLPVIITENGMSDNDWVCLDGKVHDAQRIDFLSRYLACLKRAADEGVDVMGYCHWSLMDNFEWASGYRNRFGLVHVDFRTLRRTVKDSGYWYKSLIESNGANLPDWDEATVH